MSAAIDIVRQHQVIARLEEGKEDSIHCRHARRGDLSVSSTSHATERVRSREEINDCKDNKRGDSKDESSPKDKMGD